VVEKIAVLDFETFAIKARPDYPPKPVGLAYFLPQPGKPVGLKDYLPCRSPSERQKVKGIIKDLARDGYRFLMHNASFDLDVMETHLGVAWPGTHHDSLLLAYLVEPRAPTFSLKPTAERLLGIKPKERDKLREWILEHVEGATAKTWGAYISEAPFELVRPYAIADVDLSYKLFLHYQKILRKDSQLQRAYERELKVTRVLVKMERRGIPVRVPELEHDLKQWKQCKHQLEQELFVHLKVPKAQRNEEFAWSGKNFAKLVVDSGLTDGVMPMTDKGNPSTSADNLGPLLPKKIAIKLEVRAQLQTCISTFAEAWLAQARNGGRFYARYNQVRQDYHGGGGMVGTTTGRVSMTPNLQNVIRSDKDPRVPKLRGYLGPPKGWWWLKRDYSQQEFRIFAHYEEGELLDRYRQDPKMDAHVVTGLILKERAGVDLSRRTMKDINFGVIYGMGKKKMAVKLGLEPKIAYQTMAAYHKSLPGIRVLQDNLKELAENHEPIYTWGGRRYYCEEPKVITEGYRKGDLQTFEYKLLNLLVQGSAADATKEAMIRYDATGWNEDDKGPLLLQVHDELDALARAGVRKDAMKVLRECMESIELDVPLLSDGSASNVSWDQVEDVTW
jgi:DNA polymerase-1